MENKIETISLKEFLEKTPPGKINKIGGFRVEKSIYSTKYYLKLPELFMHCNFESCQGERFFKSENSEFYLSYGIENLDFIKYTCNNCQKTEKIFSLFSIIDDDERTANFHKFGELPPFGPPTPAKLIELIGPDKYYFLLGRKCENQGLGIGAFTYYRRVVENQKNRIFDKIINVAQKVGLKSDIIEELEEAKMETQFKTGVDKIKHAIPESLRIEGHNPLVLLHKALSEGVHEKSDSECLELASSIRIILAEIAQKASNVLKEDAEVKSALNNLINKKKK
jgi:hypothetical protein